MEQNEIRDSISIADLWDVFISHVWQIVLAGLLVLAVLVGYSVFTYRPEYTSTATVYIVRQSDASSGNLTSPSSSDFSLALNTVKDCTILLKSHKVLDVIIAELGMDISYEHLREMISVNNPTNTRYLEITVTAPTPSDAKIIVDKLCDVGGQSIVDIMGIDLVNQVDQGTLTDTPSNPMIGMICYVGALAAAVVVYGIYLVAFMLDDKISSPDDVEKYLGLSVLGLVPDAHDATGTKYSRYGKGRYGYYSSNPTSAAKTEGSDTK